MLPRDARVRTGAEFSAAVRGGRRAGRRHLVVHLLVPGGGPDPAGPARAGFVVSRAVGGSVVRNRVQRRLRHLVAERLSAAPDGALLVVRANPPAAGATSADLAADLDSALGSLSRPRRAGRPS